jgi:hypothetical protein
VFLNNLQLQVVEEEVLVVVVEEVGIQDNLCHKYSTLESYY